MATKRREIVAKPMVTGDDMQRWCDRGAHMHLVWSLHPALCSVLEAPYGAFQSDVHDRGTGQHVMQIIGVRVDPREHVYRIGIRWHDARIARYHVPAIYATAFSVLANFIRAYPKAVLQCQVRMDRPLWVAFATRIGFKPTTYFYNQPFDGEICDIVEMEMGGQAE